MKLRPWVVAGCCWTFHSLVGQVPEIVVQPADIEARAGDPAGFFVSVQGSVTSYQWMRDAEPIEHSDRPYLFIPAATEEDSGTYTVHAEYSSGKLISEPATLGVFEGRAGIVDRAYTATLPIPSTLPPDWLLNSDHLEVFDNGTVWLAGYFGPWHQDYPRFTVVRPDGSPDEAFHDFSPIPGDGAISAITAGPDGGVFIGGFTDSDVGTSHFLAKVSQDGVADPGFPVQILPGPIRMIRIQDTRIIVGYIEGADPGLEFVRYSAEGLPDPAFLPEPDEIFDLIADAGGRLIVTNPERTMRLTDDGAIDTWLHRNQPMKDGSRLKLGADGMVYLLEHYFWRDSIGWTKSFYDQFGVFRLGESSHETTSVSRSQDFGYTNVDDPNPNSSPRPKDYSDSRDTRRRVPQVSFEVTGDGRPVLGGMDVSARGYNNRYNYDEESVHHHLVGYGPDTNVDPTFHAGLGADQNEGGIAVKRSPDGQFIFVFGNFQSFDDHPTSVLARVFAEPPHPYAVPPRILAVLPEAPDFPDGDPIICQILVAGSPPFSSESMIPGPNSGPGTLRVKIKYWPAINPYAKVVVWNRYGLNSLRQDVDDLISRTPTPPRFVRPPRPLSVSNPGKRRLSTPGWKEPCRQRSPGCWRVLPFRNAVPIPERTHSPCHPTLNPAFPSNAWSPMRSERYPRPFR